MSTALSAAASRMGLEIPPGPRFGVDGTLERFIRVPYALPDEQLTEAVDAAGPRVAQRHRVAAATAEPYRRGGVSRSRTLVGDVDPAHHSVDGVGRLDLAAGDAEDEQHGVQVRMASDASATSRSAGLALNATPRPAAASMSMSLAPSPTATVCSIGTPACWAKSRSALAFPGRSTIVADHPPCQLAVDDLQLVGGDEVHHQLVRQRLDHLTEAAGDDPAVKAQAPQRPQRGPRSRRQLDLRRPTSSSTSAGRPASVATRWCSDSAKSSSPRMAASVTSATAASRADPVRRASR